MKMEKPFEDPFLSILPKLNLHGEKVDAIYFLVKDFIQMNRKLGKRKVAIIHGHNHGHALKDAIWEYLKTDKNVSKFYFYNSNPGITIVEIKPLVELL